MEGSKVKSKIIEKLYKYDLALKESSGYDQRYGLFYVDFEPQNHCSKKSAYWYQALARFKVLK
ncbi:family 1 glycosylhydrolase [Streptococcus canis]|uniref:family 1 glycosylhydrolase n=1 Tax=Streptococcus canis TaxID=1329 RepID=UPI001387B28E|nr:hypothetical protein ScFU29_16060 [Streptococcus canis]